MTTDTADRGLERLICSALTGSDCEPEGPLVDRRATHGVGPGARTACSRGTSSDAMLPRPPPPVVPIA